MTTYSEFVALQQQFIRDYMAALIEGSIEIVSEVQRTAGQNLSRLEEHVENYRIASEVTAGKLS